MHTLIFYVLLTSIPRDRVSNHLRQSLRPIGCNKRKRMLAVRMSVGKFLSSHHCTDVFLVQILEDRPTQSASNQQHISSPKDKLRRHEYKFLSD
jgi:hypothetical protein